MKGTVVQSSNIFYKENIDFITLKDAFNHFVHPGTDEQANQPQRTKIRPIHGSMNVDLNALNTQVLSHTDYDTALNLFESSSQMCSDMKTFAEVLLTLRPTSTITERVFLLQN